MRYALVYCLFFAVLLADENAQIAPETLEIKEQESYINYEFPRVDDIDLANNLLQRFSTHNENYFLPLYYTIYPKGGIRAPYKPYEVKLQISAKVNLFDDILFGIGLYFAYTQVSFFQMYSLDISSPFRDNDYIPEVSLYRALDWKLFGGEFYNIRLGYLHRSNGEGTSRSAGIDRIFTELMYKNGDFRANIRGWVYTGYDPIDVRKYVGYSDLKLSYAFLERNHLAITINNLFHNYKNYKGSFLVEYKFDFERLSLYLQYFQGYGDNLYQYKTKSQSIGVGLSIKK